MIREALKEIGDAPFLYLEGGQTESGRDLAERVSAASGPLFESGAERGDVVALTGLSRVDRIVALLAAIDHGLVAWPLSEREPPRAIARQLVTSHARLIVSETAQHVREHTDAEGRWQLPGAATLLTTSGTTGQPKFAVHSLENHLSSARAAAAATGFGPGDRWLLSLAMHHVGGLAIVFRALAARGALILPERWEQIERVIRATPPSHVSLVATQLARLMDDPACVDALRACRAVLVGGGPIPESSRREATAHGVPIHVSYGSTESTALLAVSSEPAVVERPQSAGPVLPGRRVVIADDGEILISGGSLFRGYLVGAEVVDPRDAEGLFATGDLGRLDDDGVLFVLGRKDRMFVSGGENVRPEEIEVAIEGIRGVDQAIVVTVPNREYGARPVAFVAIDPGVAVRGAAVEKALRRELPGFKVPDAVFHLPTAMRAYPKPDYDELERLARDPTTLTRLD